MRLENLEREPEDWEVALNNITIRVFGFGQTQIDITLLDLLFICNLQGKTVYDVFFSGHGQKMEIDFTEIQRWK